MEAEGQLRRSLESNPTDYFSHLYLANNLGLQDRFDEAEEMYRRAVALPDEEGKGYEFFANFLDALSRHDEAEELRKKGQLKSQSIAATAVISEMTRSIRISEPRQLDGILELVHDRWLDSESTVFDSERSYLDGSDT